MKKNYVPTYQDVNRSLENVKPKLNFENQLGIKIRLTRRQSLQKAHQLLAQEKNVHVIF